MIAVNAAGAGRKRGQSALAVILKASSLEEFSQECKEARDAILSWHRESTSNGGTIMITVAPAFAIRQELPKAMESNFRRDPNLMRVLREAETEVSVLNDREKPIFQYRFGVEEPKFNEKADKPWWKFW